MPRLPSNAEKSAFKQGEYVVYDGDGRVWYASRTIAGWGAVPCPSHPARALGARMTGDTLTDLAGKIMARKAQRTEPSRAPVDWLTA